MTAFLLHPQLAADTCVIGDLPLCHVLLMKDAAYPWLVLVPRQPNVREVYELAAADQALLWQEVTQVGQQLMALHNGFKLNIGALGNVVPQLHVHVIVRQQADAAWPGPVWGVQPAQPYSPPALAQACQQLRQAFDLIK